MNISKNNTSVVEIIAASMEDIHQAAKGGADRIELVAALRRGGMTPSFSLVEQAIKESPLPVHVMLRPDALSFHYTKGEKDQLKRDALYLESLGVKQLMAK